MASTNTSQQEGPELGSSSGQLGLFVWSMHVLPGYSRFLPQSKYMHGDSKLAMHVNVYLSPCVQAGDVSRVYPVSHPVTAGTGSSTTAMLNWKVRRTPEFLKKKRILTDKIICFRCSTVISMFLFVKTFCR